MSSDAKRLSPCFELNQFDIVIDSLRDAVSSTSFSYLLSILPEYEHGLGDKDTTGDQKIRVSDLPSGCRDQAEDRKQGSKIDSRHSGIKMKYTCDLPFVTSGNCRDTPVCTKIRSKFILASNRGKPSSSMIVSKCSLDKEAVWGDDTFRTLIGKIVSNKNAFRGRRKFSKSLVNKDRVLRLDQPISNPLYNVYNPRGQVKTEEELGLELIHRITESFQAWVQTHQGETVDSGALEMELISIIRHELEVPDPDELQKIEVVMNYFSF